MRVILLSLVVAGCASNQWHTGTASDDFVDGTHVLGELIMNATRDQVLNAGGMLKDWDKKLFDLGYVDSDIVDGSEVTVWAYCFGHNSGVPLCAHHGHYVVHVPVELRHGLAFDDDGNLDTPGDLVEVELVKTSRGQVVGKLIAVYRSAKDWGDCRIESLERGSFSNAVSILGGVGPPRANWIECTHAESEGWTRRPVRGAPLSTGFPVSEWIKLPPK